MRMISAVAFKKMFQKATASQNSFMANALGYCFFHLHSVEAHLKGWADTMVFERTTRHIANKLHWRAIFRTVLYHRIRNTVGMCADNFPKSHIPDSCEGCGACCHYLQVRVQGREDRRVPRTLTISTTNGRFMKQKPDGSCMALDQETKRCTIYGRRPMSCRGSFPKGCQNCHLSLIFEAAHGPS